MLAPRDRCALRFLARHPATGLDAGALFGNAILVSDLAGLRSLAFAGESPGLVAVLSFCCLLLTVASVAWPPTSCW